jgi:hypothetical protein
MKQVPVSTRILSTRRHRRQSPTDGNGRDYTVLANGLSWHLKFDIAFAS